MDCNQTGLHVARAVGCVMASKVYISFFVVLATDPVTVATKTTPLTRTYTFL